MPDAQAEPSGRASGQAIHVGGSRRRRDRRRLAVADGDRPEISVLSDEFLDSIAANSEHPNIQIRLLEKLLKGEIRSRGRANQTQAKLFGDQIEDVLRRYEARQISGAEVVRLMVEIAQEHAWCPPPSRGARPQLSRRRPSTTRWPVAPQTVRPTPSSRRSRSDLVKSIREDLAVDWADRESTEAAIRRRIKRLLRKHDYQPPAHAAMDGEGGMSTTTRSSCSSRPRRSTATSPK